MEPCTIAVLTACACPESQVQTQHTVLLEMSAMTSLLCYRYLLEKHAVGLVPGEAFGLPGFVRISYAASMENLQKAIDRLRAGLSSLQACREQQQQVRA